MLQKLKLILSTVKYLKPIQIKYQVLYRLRKPKKFAAYRKKKAAATGPLCFCMLPPVYTSYLGNNTFTFLNLEHRFADTIDWGYQQLGKLWNYNLQYGNYLLQKDVSVEEKLRLLRSLYESLNSGRMSLEPYPVSLRIISVIRFLSDEHLKDQDIIDNLHAELHFLSARPEYHLLANHLLENAFALMVGGAFFSEDKWLKQGEDILKDQLHEQVLQDGAHFERSPMYHQIILFRLLELLDWYSQFEKHQESTMLLLKDKAALMCTWLRNISFANLSIPHFNDSTNGIAFDTGFLLDYANMVGVASKSAALSESGYRSVDNEKYECRVDFASIGPDYQPGHAHADALSFVLNTDGKPLFVEQGTSTYDQNARRFLERSTSAHNTVVVNATNQSQIWGAFRVGERARTTISSDTTHYLQACHDGYRKFKTKHCRSFQFEPQRIEIHDRLSNGASGVLFLHLHPHVRVSKINPGRYFLDDRVEVIFAPANSVHLEDYLFSTGYNKYEKSKRFVVAFSEEVVTTVHFTK